MKKVVLIDVVHWHLPLYLGALERADVEVVGVTDPTGTTGPELAKRFHTKCYDTCADLLQQVTPDLAFVFGRHSDMPATANLLLDHDIPMAIEKPCGLRTSDVRQLSEKAARKGVFVAIPFIFRLSDTFRVISNELDQVKLDHASFRFIAGAPNRYEKAGTPWMLDKNISGGGPLINVGVHLLDLFRILSGSDIVAVSAFSTSHINNLSIEDFISVTLQCASGAVGTVECGYTFPSSPALQREFTFSLCSGSHFLRSTHNGINISRDTSAGIINEFSPAEFETDHYYADFVTHVLDALEKGGGSIANFEDAAKALELVEAAYMSAAQGGQTIHLPL